LKKIYREQSFHRLFKNKKLGYNNGNLHVKTLLIIGWLYCRDISDKSIIWEIIVPSGNPSCSIKIIKQFLEILLELNLLSNKHLDYEIDI
jgi:hypothetical protein